jgi:hypothetical protein
LPSQFGTFQSGLFDHPGRRTSDLQASRSKPSKSRVREVNGTNCPVCGFYVFGTNKMPFSRLEYRRRAFECLARANTVEDPEQRAELLSVARMWMHLYDPMEYMPGHFELPKHRPDDDR